MTRAVAGRPDVVDVVGAVFFLIARGLGATRRETKAIAFTALLKHGCRVSSSSFVRSSSVPNAPTQQLYNKCLFRDTSDILSRSGEVIDFEGEQKRMGSSWDLSLGKRLKLFNDIVVQTAVAGRVGRKIQQRKTSHVYRARAKHGANCSLNTPVAT